MDPIRLSDVHRRVPHLDDSQKYERLRGTIPWNLRRRDAGRGGADDRREDSCSQVSWMACSKTTRLGYLVARWESLVGLHC